MSSAQLPRVTSIGECRSRTFHHYRKFYWAVFLLMNSLPPGAASSSRSRKHWAICGDIFVCLTWGGSGCCWHLGTLPNSSAQESSCKWRVYLTKISIMLRWGDLASPGRWTPQAPKLIIWRFKTITPPKFQVACGFDIVPGAEQDWRLFSREG